MGARQSRCSLIGMEGLASSQRLARTIRLLPSGNLYLKGVGHTPLFRHDDPDDLAHAHGGVQINDCLCEAVFGEVNHNLFTHGSTRILAIIDQGLDVTYPYGRVPIALAVRAGGHLRPGNLLARKMRRGDSLLDLFVRMTRETGQLVLRSATLPGNEMTDSPDLSATMLRIINDTRSSTRKSFAGGCCTARSPRRTSS